MIGLWGQLPGATRVSVSALQRMIDLALGKGFKFSELSITSRSTGTNICVASVGEVLIFLQGVESNPIVAQDFTPVP